MGNGLISFCSRGVPLCVLIGIFSYLFPCSLYGQQYTVSGRIEMHRQGADSGHPENSSAAVVWLTRIDEPAEPTPVIAGQGAQLVQKHKTFSPHVLVVQAGSPVAFPNRDPFFHNVFSLFEGKRFDLGLYEAGSTRSVVFDREGISYIFCNIHPEMSAVVIALRTPYYGISDAKGVLSITDVPAGHYRMHVWHELALPESLNDLSRILLVSETTHSFGIIRLTEQRNMPQGHKNKYGQDYNNPTPGVTVYQRP